MLINASEDTLPCDDFLQFTSLLSSWRKNDDRVRHELNNLLPTASFQSKVDHEEKCRSFLTQMLSEHERRNCAIKRCLAHSTARLVDLREDQANIDSPTKQELSRQLPPPVPGRVA
ncbi:unnamed protein product [Dicrocoelium dendriticum]|nr:unnamed protein product [Dicrocoelium dendriticum]